MDALHVALTLALFLGPGALLIAPAARRPAAILLLAAAVAAVATASLGERSLTVEFAFAAYVGQQVQSKAFVVDEVTAPGWQWPALVAVWAVAWASVALRTRLPERPLAAPLALAWGGSALLLLLQKAAAPAPLALGLDLPPLPPFELAILPAALATALRLGAACPRVWHLPLYLSLFLALAHLPLAILGTIATRQGLGTWLDVHTIDFVVNPLTQVPMELAAGSTEQLAWLLWLPQLLVWPALTMLSAGGVGFAAAMARRQRSLDSSR